MRGERGQAGAEYIAILLVVGAVLAGAAGVAGAVPSVGERVVGTVRIGLCIVGGDLCRTADAAAAGLSPCLMRERGDRRSTTLDIAVVRLGEHGEWQLALRSDGSAVVTQLAASEAGGTAGIGVTFSPIGVDAGVSAALTAAYHAGRAWRFADASAARAFLAAARGDPEVAAGRPPDERWDAVGGHADATAELAVADLASVGVEAGGDAVLGLRRAGDARTLTFDVGSVAPALAVDLPGFPSAPGPRRTVVADVTWVGGAARELLLRAATRRGGRMEEVTARLDLRDAVSRDVAGRVLRPGGGAADLRALAARIASHGIVERDGYAVSEHRGGFGLGAKLGVALGLSHETVAAERRLVDAVAWIDGGPPRRRFDCLGV
jgi:hypothetical protein